MCCRDIALFSLTVRTQLYCVVEDSVCPAGPMQLFVYLMKASYGDSLNIIIIIIIIITSYMS
jgi:hypothetical protein